MCTKTSHSDKRLNKNRKAKTDKEATRRKERDRHRRSTGGKGRENQPVAAETKIKSKSIIHIGRKEVVLIVTNLGAPKALLQIPVRIISQMILSKSKN